MADVFISYSAGKADNTVRQIADALDRAGISCWYMGRDSQYGRYPDKITQAIRDCKVFLLMLDEASNNSKHVLNEVSIAFASDPIILIFRLDNCILSKGLCYYLTTISAMNPEQPDNQRIQEFIEQIINIVGPNKVFPTRQIGAHIAVVCPHCHHKIYVPSRAFTPLHSMSPRIRALFPFRCPYCKNISDIA